MIKSGSRALYSKKLKPYIKGTVCGLITLAIMSILSAAAYNALGAPEGTDGVLAFLSLVTACGVSGFFCAGTKGKNGLVSGTVCGLLVLLPMLLISVISGSFTGDRLMIRLILCVIFAAAGGVVGVNLANR